MRRDVIMEGFGIFRIPTFYQVVFVYARVAQVSEYA